MAWEITGNSGTNPTANFLGTTDSQPLVIKAGGVEAMRFFPDGHIEIGVSPAERDSSLHIIRTNYGFGSAYTSLTIENPEGTQSIQAFSFAGDQKASIRADSNGNLVFNAVSSTYYLSRDYGDPDAITIVPHNIGRTLAIAGNLKAFSGYFEGNVEVTGDVVLANADCAEDFSIGTEATVEPGTVMVLGEQGLLFPSTYAYDKRVAGVVSGAGNYKPGIILDRQESVSNRQPIALLGKVYCKVDAAYAPIEVGDLLTTSDTLGSAMKASEPQKTAGSILGKALSALKGGKGLIPVLVALQ